MEKLDIRSWSRVMMVALVTGSLCFGCAMTGDDNGGSGGTAVIPRKKDSVTMKNNDVLMGNLDFSVFELTTPYLPTLKLKKDDIDSIEFFGDGSRVKVRTKHGDVIRGTSTVKTFTLTESRLTHAPLLKCGDIKLIRCK